MKRFIIRTVFVLLTFTMAGIPFQNAQAQCAMCSLTAESSVKNGNTQGNKLNKGILVLLSAPYLAVGLVGFLWYRKFRKGQSHSDSETLV